MNYTQNEKIEQVTDTTIVVGIDIGSRLIMPEFLIIVGVNLQKESFRSGRTLKDLILFLFG